LPIAIWFFNTTKSPYLIGVAHIIVWLPLFIYLIKTEIINQGGKLKTPYGFILLHY